MAGIGGYVRVSREVLTYVVPKGKKNILLSSDDTLFSVFIKMILMANYKDVQQSEDTIQRGCVMMSLSEMHDFLGHYKNKIRRILNTFIGSGLIEIVGSSKTQKNSNIYRVKNYDGF